MALTNKLENIGNAIRSKTGGTELLKLDEMPAAIESIETGGGGADIPEEAFSLTDSFDMRFFNNNWNWFIENYGNKIVTKNITSANQCFSNSHNLTKIPFTINFKGGSNYSNINDMFRVNKKLTQLPNITGLRLSSCSGLLYECQLIREIPEGFYKDWDFSYLNSMTSEWSGAMNSMFGYCYSLRKIPVEMITSGNKKANYNYAYFYSGFNSCYALDELVDLPLFYTATWTTNAFNLSFNRCSRIKNLTFETNEDSTPKVMNWKNQTIDLSNYVGYASGYSWSTTYNSGITRDTQITNDSSYQALKNNPDCFTALPEYSRYNHDSAVNTINSLPDTSAYLASAGGTNTIKFYGDSGSLTDGGAINTLTAEEIAVAAAKGWTVTLT